MVGATPGELRVLTFFPSDSQPATQQVSQPIKLR